MRHPFWKHHPADLTRQIAKYPIIAWTTKARPKMARPVNIDSIARGGLEPTLYIRVAQCLCCGVKPCSLPLCPCAGRMPARPSSKSRRKHRHLFHNSWPNILIDLFEDGQVGQCWSDQGIVWRGLNNFRPNLDRLVLQTAKFSQSGAKSGHIWSNFSQLRPISEKKAPMLAGRVWCDFTPIRPDLARLWQILPRISQSC